MKAQEFAELLIKFFALYFFSLGVAHFLAAGLPAAFVDQSRPVAQKFLNFSGFFAYAFVSVVLWFNAQKLSLKIAAEFKGKVTTKVSFDQALSLIFICIGFYLLAQAIPKSINLTQMLLNEEVRPLIPEGRIKGQMVDISVYLVLALYFIIGGRGLRKLILRIRQA